MKENGSEGPHRKRLLTDPNPKESFVTASPESTVSSDSSSDRFAKKTRELPNLSDCHGCAVRINYTNPRDRLQPLDSMWRIVLLCKKCTKRVKSGDLCPYCFTAVVDETDYFKCGDCHHSIHKDCVSQNGSELGFSVCVDCWVPDAVANSIRVRKKKLRKKNNEACDQAATLPESTNAVGETNELNSLGVAAVTKTSENVIRKAVVANNDVELAKGVLNVGAGGKVEGSCEKKAVDDAELAFMLHRAINGSTRTSTHACLMSSFRGDDKPLICYSRRRAHKKFILMNSYSLDLPLICYYRRHGKGGLRNSASLNAPLLCYYRRRFGKKACSHDRECVNSGCKRSDRVDKHLSVYSNGLKACSCGSNSEDSLNGNECEENDGGISNRKPPRYLLKYYRFRKGTPRPSVLFKASDCDSSMDSAALITESRENTRNPGNGNECDNICENCEDNTSRLLKYKRSLISNPESRCKVEEFFPLLSSNYPVESRIVSDPRL